MGSFSIWHWLVVAVLVVLLFGGRGKISGLMTDFAQGIKGFRKGLADDEPAKPAAPEDSKTIEATVTPAKDKTEA
jgi:sec-independent protein translocase protein TatA